MSGITLIYVLGGVIFLLMIYFAWRIGKTYRKYQGQMVVTCPETHQPAGVRVDAPHVALTVVGGEPDLRLKECSRWPERQNCGQDCLAQIELSPQNCLVRTMLTHWYAEKRCIFCGKAFEAIDSYDHRAVFWYDMKPALISPEGKIVEWRKVPVETLPLLLTTYKPVCWNCLIAETFRLKYPELVIDRPTPGNKVSNHLN